MPAAASGAGSASALNCGLVRERGIERTSTRRSTSACFNISTSSATERVEWPMVNTVPRGQLFGFAERPDVRLVRRFAAIASHIGREAASAAPLDKITSTVYAIRSGVGVGGKLASNLKPLVKASALRDQVYARLRESIRTGRMRPGE